MSMRTHITRLARAMILCAATLTASCRATTTAPAESLQQFEERLEALRLQSHIPAITAVIAREADVVWARGFGSAELATDRPAADTTVYHLASLTKPFATTVLLQLVEENRVSLDAPVSDYGVVIPGPGVIRVRHLLSHTSEETPGSVFRYNGNRFALLDSVIARAATMSFAAAVQTRIIARLGLKHTAPDPQAQEFAMGGHDRAAYERNMARGYTWSANKYALTAYPTHFSSAAGLTASARDVATFSLALDRGALLKPETLALSLTPVLSLAGDTLPYALGWFVTRYRGVRVVWHYGLWTANSSLIIKVPDRGLTFVVLANTDGLSEPYALGAGRLVSSPWARAFLDAFVIGSAQLP
jgi:CubicO group peptidase (beta-lactamase class C family)